MPNDVTNEQPEQVGDTCYLPIADWPVGELLDRAHVVARSHGQTLRRVMLCGASDRTARQWRAWLLDHRAQWVTLDVPYVGANTLRATYGRDGETVSVQRSAGWFGDAGVAAVCEATKHVRHEVGRTGARMVGSPATTGLGMLHKLWGSRDHSYPVAPDDVQTLLRSTSGQGRFELFDRGRERGGGSLVSFDARFAYGAIARTVELPVGEPVELVAPAEPEPYAAAWVQVAVDIGDDAPPFGLLPLASGTDRRTWTYPAAGSFVTWCHWAEAELARQHGYRCRVLRAIVWPRRARALAPLAAHLIGARDRIERLPIDEQVQTAVSAAMRNVMIQTVGMLHGRDTVQQVTVSDASEIPGDAEGWAPAPGGGWSYSVRRPAHWRADDSHPEWTTTIWAIARTRLVRQMLAVPPAELVAVALDSMLVTARGVPVHGRAGEQPGTWRVTGKAGRWQPFGSMADVYAHMRAAS